MRPLSESTARVTSKNFERKYIALGRIVKNWPQIIGEKMAAKAQPARIQYRKKRKKSDPTQTILEIAVNNADATLLHYQKNLILERINHIFGERWIADIRFVPVRRIAVQKTSFSNKSFRALTSDEKTSVLSLVEGVSDHDLKARLDALARKVIIKDNT